jgi:hypothetical protein
MTKAQKLNPDPARTPASRDRAQPTPEKPTREQREKTMDKTLADSYPASDPPSTIPNPSDDSGG